MKIDDFIKPKLLKTIKPIKKQQQQLLNQFKFCCKAALKRQYCNFHL